MHNKTLPYVRDPARVFLLGAWVSPVSQSQAVETILSWCATEARRYAVTPNLDHCRMLKHDRALTGSYDKAGLVLADGWPLVAASYVTPFPLRRRVTGADLVMPLCGGCADRGYAVFLLGATDEVLSRVAATLRSVFPGLIIAGAYAPARGFERNMEELARINAIIMLARPHLVLVALGAPKQEIWMASHIPALPVGAAVGVGAALDYIAGKQRRAPAFLRWMGLEWAWRAATDPRRLAWRYAACLLALPGLAGAHLRHHFVTKTGVRLPEPA